MHHGSAISPLILILVWSADLTIWSAPFEEIPLERCDVLPVVRVKIEGREFRFLIDTAATSMLNIKTFAGGGFKAIEISSWKGVAITSAREVHIPELCLGSQKLRNLIFPAIDLSPISQACGGSIDGIFGVDLLEEFRAKLDLGPSDQLILGNREDRLLKDLINHQEDCVRAFNQVDIETIQTCFDPQVVLFSSGKEIRGRDEMIDYLNQRYFKSRVQLELDLKDHRIIGDAFWFGYDLKFKYPDRLITMKGMAVCRRENETWRLLSMHNSSESEPPD
jgi:hypothetical protein